MFEYELSDFEITGEILLYYDQIEYKEFLNKILLEEFNNSIFEFINNFIKQDTEFNINIDILEKYNIKLDLFENKLENELKYYLFLLNNSNEIGITTKKAFLNLYNYIEKEFNIKINELTNEFSYDLDYFYMTNKKIFIDEYFNYLKNIKSKKIFKLQEYIDKIFSNQKFNNSLEEIIKYNIYNNFIEEIRDNANKSIIEKTKYINGYLNSLNESLSKGIFKVKIADINPDMVPIMNKNDEFDNIINNQTNSFSFNINQEPYNLFLNFTKENLEPPLIEIKTIYDKIQDELLIQIFKKVDDMPNCYLFIMENLPTNNITSIISDIILETEELFVNYTNYLTNDSNNYKYNFSYLRRLDYIKNLKLNNTKKDQIKYKFKNEAKVNETFNRYNNFIDKKDRNLNTAFEGELCFNDIKKEILLNIYSIGNFSTLYLSKDFRYLNTTLNIFNNKISLYLTKLENPLSIITLRMSTLLTEEKLEQFKNRIYKEMNLIKEYINNHTGLISNRTNDFMYLLSNTSITQLKDLGNTISNIIENLYDKLLVEIMSTFKSKKVKFNQRDLKIRKEFDLTPLTNMNPDLIDPEIAQDIADISKITFLSVNFDSEEYLNEAGLDEFIQSIDQFINDDEAPIEITVIFPIFFIPFIAKFRLEYGFELGIKISTENRFLNTDFYAEAHSCASASAGVFLGVVEFGGGLRGLLGYGRVGMMPYIDFKYLISKIRYYVKLATLKFQVFAYMIHIFPRIYWITFRFMFFTVKIPIIILEPTRFEIGSQWTKGLQQYLYFDKNY